PFSAPPFTASSAGIMRISPALGLSAAQACFPGRRAGMIDRNQSPALVNALKQGLHVRNRAGPYAKIHEFSRAIQIGVSFEGCDLSAGNQQQAVKVRLQLAKRVKVGDGVVIGDRYKVEPPGTSSFERKEH